ncbi:MAG: hypothetical protein QW273_00230 [Candidatus Pacearchaeota archaeon]
MDPIKEAFSKVKEEISFLKEEIFKLNERISTIERNMSELLKNQHKEIGNSAYFPYSTDNSAHFPAVPQEIRGLKSQNFYFSTGNKGVPTDKPTDRQTNQQTDKQANFYNNDSSYDFERVKTLLDSLDSAKKEIRLKFKRLTNKEMQLFSTIYSLEEQGINEISYRLLANYLNLTESSIRDYTNKIIAKGIPLIKIKPDNKTVFLKISDDLKKVVSLQTILKLREI